MTLSTADAAKQLGVSPATVRNWLRAGHLPGCGEEDVAALGERIRAGEFGRLRSRANKTASEKKSVRAAGGADADVDDPLGAEYERLRSAGKKSCAGAFFTPVQCVEDSLAELAGAVRPAVFLDPCCGTGRYLLHAAKRFNISPENLYGFDSDPVAAAIAKANLPASAGNVRCLDFLADPAADALCGRVDVVMTNPPWGAARSSARGAGGESFSLFLEKSLRLLRPGGTLSFLLPEAVLGVKAHAGIRRLLLEQTAIVSIAFLGRVFPDVFTSVVRLLAIKKPAPANWMVRVKSADKTHPEHSVPQARFAGNAGCAFDAGVTGEDKALLEKIYSVPHVTLRGNADWALGIVTGDNERFLLDAPEAGAEPVLRGRDIFPFVPGAPGRFLHFRPELFQQVAPERLYRAPEKLVYRFVSERLVFAYDGTGCLTLNSANIVIPRIPGMSVKAALAFLNSAVFQFVFAKKFPGRKVLRSALEALPFPLIDAAGRRALERAAELRDIAEIDRRVCAIFGVSLVSGAID